MYETEYSFNRSANTNKQNECFWFNVHAGTYYIIECRVIYVNSYLKISLLQKKV